MTVRHRRFLFLFALANAGGFVAYVPFLTLVFPMKIEALAGASRIEWLGAATLVGALSASLGNLAFGWASDCFGSRRAWAATGFILTPACYVLLHLATSWSEILVAMVAYQLALNMMIAPLAAWAADVVPDRDKGLLGGLLAGGPAAGAMAGVLVTLPAVSNEAMQLTIICLMIAALAGPLIVLGAPERREPARQADPLRLRAYFDFGLLWASRLLVQIAGAALFTFLLYFFQSHPVPASQFQIAVLSAATLLVAFPATLILGRISDRIGPRKPFLLGAVAMAALGLLIMAWQEQLAVAMIGYAIFGCATASFLALHSAFSMQLLPSPTRHGRDLGVLNLTNTLPNLIAPALAIWLVPGRGFALLLTVLAALMMVAGLCIVLIGKDSALGRRASAGGHDV